jgi:antitoxin ParD1/3/4
MSDRVRLTVSLTSQLARLVREAVAAGDYASSSDLIQEALGLWAMAQAPHDAAAIKLRKLWEEGLLSGESAPLDMEAIKRRARAAFRTS